MKAAFSEVLFPARIVLSALLLAAPAQLFAQTGGSCGCKNIPELINLINMDNAAIVELTQARASGKQTDLFNDLLPDPNPTRMTKGESLMNAIKEAMSRVENRSAPTAGGDTDSVTCESKVSADNECLRSLMERREERNRATCEANKRERRLGQNDDERSFKLLEVYIVEQLALYNLEIGEILRILGAMPISCRADDWFGTITYSETISERNQQVVFEDPNSKAMGVITFLGAETNTSEFLSRSGTIWLNGGSPPFSSWRAEGKSVFQKIAKGMVDCTGGLKPKPPSTPSSSGSYSEVDSIGADTMAPNVSVDVSEDGRTFFVDFEIPDLILKRSGMKTESDSGCKEKPDISREPFAVSDFRWSGYSFPASGTIFKGNPDKISGSEVRGCKPSGTCTTQTEPTQGSDGRQTGKTETTRSTSVLVTYRLYRLRF